MLQQVGEVLGGQHRQQRLEPVALPTIVQGGALVVVQNRGGLPGAAGGGSCQLQIDRAFVGASNESVG